MIAIALGHVPSEACPHSPGSAKTGFVYKWTNLVNCKGYIGKACQCGGHCLPPKRADGRPRSNKSDGLGPASKPRNDGSKRGTIYGLNQMRQLYLVNALLRQIVRCVARKLAAELIRERHVVLLEHAGGGGLGFGSADVGVGLSGERVGGVVDAGHLDADGCAQQNESHSHRNGFKECWWQGVSASMQTYGCRSPT